MEHELITALVSLLGGSGLVGGILLALLRRWITKRDNAREEREKARAEKDEKIENLMLLMMNENRATYILVRATAKAVQRIPDAKCNGDMKEALEKAEECQREEKTFLVNQGIEHIFEK